MGWIPACAGMTAEPKGMTAEPLGNDGTAFAGISALVGADAVRE